MRIAADMHVTLRYALALSGDPDPDCNQDGRIVEFVWGRGQIIAGLEARLEGLSDGDRLQVTLPPSEAFGERDPTLDIRVARDEFPAEARMHLQPGLRFRGPHPHDAARAAVFTITAVDGETIHATANHPLAGQELRIACEVLAVRAATSEELAERCCQGACGSGGCGTCNESAVSGETA
ncbi:MAG: FKBP-type peptidyl-prolyl cis-trans isomerase [Planctomycetes bacterium]|nr:FKBP-type peptidyl-prolyl cis-trans isomerase [Planctomycetota bacterium]